MSCPQSAAPRCASWLIPFAVVILGGCQGHLPALDSYPKGAPTPKVADVVNHIQCELSQIVKTAPDGSTGEQQMAHRIQNNNKIGPLLANLVNYHFVATAQITLEVTDAEGLTPSLTFMNAATTHSVGLGGQWNGTQDRTVTLNYAIDLAKLTDAATNFCLGASSEQGSSGLQGNLDLADIVADGLLSLDRSAGANVYASTGPVPPTVARAITQIGKITLPPLDAGGKEKEVSVDSLKGTILFAPQSAGVQTQGTVTLSGLLTLEGQKFLVNWTGSIIAPNAVAPGGLVYFTLAGALVPEPGADLKTFEKRWGFSPTVTLTGTVNNALQAGSLTLAGVITAAAGSDYAKTGVPPIAVVLPESHPPHPAAGTAGPAAKSAGASPSSGAGGTSFGSLVDFVLVYGLNGSPSYSFQNVKAITGMGSPFISAMRTKTDSLAITFVASCQKNTPDPMKQAASYWDSIGVCDELGSALGQGASVGYQNNSLMILRNFLVRPQ